MDGVSICMTAYRAAKYIKQAIDSIYSQTYFTTNDNWELLIGVDGCKETLQYLQSIRKQYDNHLHVYMMDSNEGTYVTTNTLISISKYDYILRFDSDDILLEDAIETMYSNIGNNDLCRYKFITANESLEERKVGKIYSVGSIFTKKSILLKFGCYKPWPCSADSELVRNRLESFCKIRYIDRPLFIYRTNPISLTHNGKTGMSTNLRKYYRNICKSEQFTNMSDAIIECKTNTYTEIFLDSDISSYQQKIKLGNINTKLKRVVYTCTIKNLPIEIANKQEGFDYICFTDQEIESDTWKIRPIPDELKKLDNNRMKEAIKICPHKYLPEYDFSIYVENDYDSISSILNLNIDLEYDKTVYIKKGHSKCIYRDAPKYVAARKDDSHTIRCQIFRYQRAGYPIRYGTVKTNFIIRLHNSVSCIDLMNEWMKEILNGSYIEQLSFNYCVWKTKSEAVKYIE